MRELADPRRVVRRDRGAGDPAGLVRARLPERHLGDLVGLLDDLLREPERLERLHAARLDAVRLTDGETFGAALDDAGHDSGKLGELRGRDDAGWT